jgi:endonuclease YncB( thermonuclease family)
VKHNGIVTAFGLLLCWTLALRPADVVKTADGDTFHAWIQTWDDQKKFEKFRLQGIQAPEMERPTLAEAKVSQAFVDAWLRKEPSRILYCGTRDKYGRAVAVISRQGEDLGQLLIDHKLAVPSTGR